MDALEKVIEIYGNQSELAGKIGVSKMTITHWKRRGVPIERALELERLTNGQVKASDLRSELKNRPKRKAA